MISKEEIQNLAELSRLKLSEEEIAALQKDFDSILAYVGQISRANSGQRTADSKEIPQLINVMREDEPRVEGDPMAGKQEAILSQAPKRKGDYFVVRKIIDREG